MPEIKSKEITIVGINTLIPHPKNMNKHSDDQIDRLCKLISYQGFRNPLVVQMGTNLIVAGHGRLLAAKKLGIKEVPVTYQEFDSEAQLYAYMTSDNAIASWAELDLGMVNSEMLDFGPDFDIDLLGIKDFVVEPVDKLEPGCDENEIPTIRNVVTRKGDIWILGNHRLACGDSTMIDDVDKLMSGQKAQISFTSPPYNAGDEVEGGGTAQKYEKHDDEMSEGSYLELLKAFTSNTLAHSEMSFVNIQHLSGNKISFVEYLDFFKQNLVDIAIWNKERGTPCLAKRLMNSAFEYVLIFSAEENPPKTIKTAPVFHGTINNVYTAPRQTKNEFAEVHRATFPLHLPEYFISNFSTGSVLELFNGTGTTMIACEKLGRKCFAMDMDELYIDTTINRWQKYTGRKAVLESSGETYDEIYSRTFQDKPEINLP